MTTCLRMSIGKMKENPSYAMISVGGICDKLKTE